MDEHQNIEVKVRKYPGTSWIDILDHIRLSLRKALEQVIIHAGTNCISNNTNYLKNIKKYVKLVKETCKDTKLNLSSVICCTDIKDITDAIKTKSYHPKNYYEQQNVGFIDKGNIKKSDLNSKWLHLYERGSSKLAKSLLGFIHWICKPGISVSYESKVSVNCVNKALSHFKRNHPQPPTVCFIRIFKQ